MSSDLEAHASSIAVLAYRVSNLQTNLKTILQEATMNQETPPNVGKGELLGAVVTIVIFVTVILSSMAEFLGFRGMEWPIITVGVLGVGAAIFLFTGR